MIRRILHAEIMNYSFWRRPYNHNRKTTMSIIGTWYNRRNQTLQLYTERSIGWNATFICTTSAHDAAPQIVDKRRHRQRLWRSPRKRIRGANGRRRLARRNREGVALRPTIIISGAGSGVRRIFDREIRLFYQQANGRRRLMQLWRRPCR